jgi:8-oxo-dGTP pyrophosphatase MutT (NUDIX family)
MHRAAVLKLLRAHGRRALAPEEEAAVAATIELVEANPACLLRTCMPGHVTGSAWIVSPDRRLTLLTLHRKLGKWLQLGGHADGDEDLLSVALREAREESGLAGIRVARDSVFDVDRHWIPAHGGEPGHWHHDLRFLLEADPSQPLTVSSESRELAWVEVSSVPALNPEESMMRMVRKTLVEAPHLGGERQT